MQALPIEPPKIHWKFYRQFLGSQYTDWINEMQEKYENTIIPFPKDVHSGKFEIYRQKLKAEVDDFKKQSNARIAAYQCILDEINCTTPIEQMTWEEFMISFPKISPNFLENPTFWPHTPEEQIGYVPPENKNDVKFSDKTKTKASLLSNSNKII